jgi:hypothetical protein
MLIYLGEGRHRRVFKRGNFVIKVPINDFGLASNFREAKTYQCTSEGWLFGIRYAACRLDKNENFLIMEYVNVKKYDNSLPSWVGYVDCQQVGYNRRGHLVAYDYGY